MAKAIRKTGKKTKKSFETNNLGPPLTCRRRRRRRRIEQV